MFSILFVTNLFSLIQGIPIDFCPEHCTDGDGCYDVLCTACDFCSSIPNECQVNYCNREEHCTLEPCRSCETCRRILSEQPVQQAVLQNQHSVEGRSLDTPLAAINQCSSWKSLGNIVGRPEISHGVFCQVGPEAAEGNEWKVCVDGNTKPLPPAITYTGLCPGSVETRSLATDNLVCRYHPNPISSPTITDEWCSKNCVLPSGTIAGVCCTESSEEQCYFTKYCYCSATTDSVKGQDIHV